MPYYEELGTSNFPILGFFIFALSVFFVTLLMLNLVIAIISSVYENVKNSRVLANNYEKAVIINEIEINMPNRYKKKLEKRNLFQKYLLIAFPQENDELNDNNTNDKISENIIINKLVEIEERIKNLEKINFQYLQNESEN